MSTKSANRGMRSNNTKSMNNKSASKYATNGNDSPVQSNKLQKKVVRDSSVKNSAAKNAANAEVAMIKMPPKATNDRSTKKKNIRLNETKPKPKGKKSGKTGVSRKTVFDRLMQNLGFYVGNVILKDPRAIEAAEALDLQPWHLRRLKLKFDRIDIDGSGNIDYDEFFEAMGAVRSPFTDQLFSLIDLDGSGTIEFDEFVRVLATYCMFSKDEILRFCFECFDVDGSGSIDEKEFIELCKCINNASPTFPNNFKRALEEFDVNADGLIDYGEFLEIDRRYPLILFPAFNLQDMMQKCSLGERVWIKIIENYQENKRIEEYKALHGGRAPPESTSKRISRFFCPCFHRDKVHIRVGAEMENRHRGGGGEDY